jgi:hypothetical protein
MIVRPYIEIGIGLSAIIFGVTALFMAPLIARNNLRDMSRLRPLLRVFIPRSYGVQLFRVRVASIGFVLFGLLALVSAAHR